MYVVEISVVKYGYPNIENFRRIYLSDISVKLKIMVNLLKILVANAFRRKMKK